MYRHAILLVAALAWAAVLLPASGATAQDVPKGKAATSDTEPHDPATPHEGGISLAKTLGASLLTVEGEQHGVALTAGNACINNIVADYLIGLKIPTDGARCVL